MGGRVEAGDIVLAQGSEWVVVDVAEDEGTRRCVLRKPNDLTLENPLAQREEDVRIIGHVESVPGWTEVRHGEWVKSE